METSAGAAKPNKSTLIKLAVLGVAGVAMLRGLDVRALIDQSLAMVREAGPGAFFAGMAVLPAVGFPLSSFTLSAGSVFAPTLGWPVVLAATWLALSINVTLTYVGARWLARPWLGKLVLRLGYSWPQVQPSEYWTITILLRVTPGPPLCAAECTAETGAGTVADLLDRVGVDRRNVWDGVYDFWRGLVVGQGANGDDRVWRNHRFIGGSTVFTETASAEKSSDREGLI
ncbi:MAG: hypothetical protein J6386_01200 [Candidatus Synoicihabitans palmerolidicus]|nr:hypothetical protein [Candidatus Synoicihabitans palmerolidicus]